MPAESSTAPTRDVTEPTTFAALGVPAPLVGVLDGQGIATPFPVQVATLPDGLAGRDILGRAQTGSGKTLGFSLPLVSRLAGGSTRPARPRGLVLVPTRELATQVSEVLKPLASAMGLWVTTIYGGVTYGPQVSALQRRTDIVVATPGRLADLIGQGKCDLSDVKITVIDEADQMADLGFLPIVRRLLDTTPDKGQRMLFSATLDAAIDVLARRFLHDPVLHSVDENSSPAEIEHHVVTVDTANRVAVIAALVGGEKRSLVFTRTKHGTERLARQLTEAGIPAAELHGNLRQGARSRNLAAFGSGLARVMVATDIAARGIHIDGIDLVIHADPPTEHKAYVHRSGRTARGGADGVVVTLQTRAQSHEVTVMMRKAGITPHEAVAVDAGSDVLTEIAGPPAPRVTVAGKVSELVRAEDRLASNRDQPGPGKPWEGRPRRDHGQGRDRDRGPRDSRPARADRPSRFQPADRPARGERFEQADRPSRFERNERPATADRDRPRSFGGDSRPARFDRDDRFNQGNRGDRFEGGDRRSDNRGFGGREADNRGSGGRNYGSRQDRPENRGSRGSQGSNDWWPRSTQPGTRGPGSSWRSFSQANGNRVQRDDRNRDDRGRDDRSRGNGYRDDRASGGDRQFRDSPQDRDGRPARDERPGNRLFRDDRSSPSFRDDRPARDDRATRDDRPARDERFGREQRPSRAARPQASGRPQSGGQSRPPAGRTDRPQAGGHSSGASGRSGYSAGRGAAGKRRDSGQGRHF